MNRTFQTCCIGIITAFLLWYAAVRTIPLTPPKPSEPIKLVTVTAEEHHGGIPRSADWPLARAAYLSEHNECEACGRKKSLQVHHVRAFHCEPTLELDPTNFITLCTDGPCNLNCHFVIGHAGNTKTNNPNVRRDAARMREMLMSGIDCEVQP